MTCLLIYLCFDVLKIGLWENKEHLILWMKQTDFDTMSFVWSIMYNYKQDWYSIQRNQPNKQSVKREHIHLIKR